MSAHKDIEGVIIRCMQAIREHDPDAAATVRVEVSRYTTAGLCYAVHADSAKLAIGTRKSALICGIGGSLKTAEQLFREGLGRVVAQKEQAARAKKRNRVRSTSATIAARGR